MIDYGARRKVRLLTRHGLVGALFCLQCFGAVVYGADTLAVYERDIQQQKQNIQAISKKIASARRNINKLEESRNQLKMDLRAKRAAAKSELRAAQRVVSKKQQQITKIQREIDLYADRIVEIEKENQRARARFQAQNAIMQELNRAQHNKLLERNESKTRAYQVEMARVEETQNDAYRELEKSEFVLLQARSAVQNIQIDKHPEIVAVERKLDEQQRRLQRYSYQHNEAQEKLRLTELEKPTQVIPKAAVNAKKKKPVEKRAIVNPPKVQKSASQTKNKSGQKPENRRKSPAYVFVISGGGENIEEYLDLKDWVESYGAKYIQGKWNALYARKNSKRSASSDLFLEQIEAEFRKIPKQSKLIIIGHGLGGGAAIKAATQAAYKLKRQVDYLIALDPIGQGNLRANIVYDVAGKGCADPDGSVESNSAYLKCIASSSKRKITPNVKNFYNRWQKESENIGDLAREIALLGDQGQMITKHSSTGKFIVADSSTRSDQKRVYYGGNPDAHQVLLEEVSQALPNLLIDYLR